MPEQASRASASGKPLRSASPYRHLNKSTALKTFILLAWLKFKANDFQYFFSQSEEDGACAVQKLISPD